ncbi:MAG: hypothetical protein C0497_07720 [Gemmatimonas sp.]|nr:hypothetical protein [Gemmatimonas sp.]
MPVLLYLAEHPGSPYARVAEALGVSTSTVHAAHTRLIASGLAHRIAGAKTEVARGPLLEFLQYAVQYLFPATFLPKARGIPTGLSEPVLAEFNEDPEFQDLLTADASPQVWPSHLGSVVGVGILPLVADAPSIASRDPSLYRWLALVDVVRGGDARARTFARRAFKRLVAALP